MKRCWMLLLALALFWGCDDGGDDSDGDDGIPDGESDGDAGDATDAGSAETDTGDEAADGDTGTGESEDGPLEIAGTYTTEWGQTIAISETEWVDTADWGSFTYAIADFDNEMNYLVAENGEDDYWSRFEWTIVSYTVYFCQTIYDAATRADADVDENLADPADIDAGCNGFGWTELQPVP
jgi:hypothetical protein